MRILILILVAMMISTVAYAEDFASPLVQGQVMVKAIAAPSSPGASDTVSLGAVRTDTGLVVFCDPAGPGATVEGMTDVIVATTEDIFLVFHAYPADGCSLLPGVDKSIASADRYRVIFGPPGQPLLLQAVMTP